MINDHVSPMQSSQTPKRFVTPAMSMLLCFSLVAFATGCGATAIISRNGDAPVEGKITRSDEDTVFVQTFTGHGEVPVARQNIADIDHPGNVAAVVGGVESAIGVAMIVVLDPDCDRDGAAYCTRVYTPAVIGASTFIYGMAVWLTSRSAAHAPNPSTARRFTVVPVASMDKKNDFYGVTARVSF